MYPYRAVKEETDPHERAEELMLATKRRALTDSEQRELAAHLAGCNACRAIQDLRAEDVTSAGDASVIGSAIADAMKSRN